MKQNESNAPKFRGSLFRAILVVLFIVPMLFVGASARAQTSKANNSAQTIVLVHGAWADSAGWSGVISRLQADGYTVWAVPNPLRGLSADAAYVASILNTIPGPIILVAHSYGGAVITNAATGNPNVKALVYIDGFAPDEGETGFQLLGMEPPPGASRPCVSADPFTIFNFVPYPGAPSGDFDVYIKPEVYPSCFANTIEAEQAAVLAASQRPITLSASAEPSGPPAWKTIPSWYLVGTLDKAFHLISRPSWPNAPMPKSFGSKRRTQP